MTTEEMLRIQDTENKKIMVNRVVNKLFSEPNVLRFIEGTRTLFIDIEGDPVCVKHRGSNIFPDHPSDECIEVTFTTLKELPPEELKKKSESGEYNKEYLLKL